MTLITFFSSYVNLYNFFNFVFCFIWITYFNIYYMELILILIKKV